LVDYLEKRHIGAWTGSKRQGVLYTGYCGPSYRGFALLFAFSADGEPHGFSYRDRCGGDAVTSEGMSDRFGGRLEEAHTGILKK